MSTTARLDLAIWRNDETYELPLRIIGPDFSQSSFLGEVRLAPDTPGLPAIRLNQVVNGNAEGIRFVGKTYVDGRFVNDVRIRINKSTRQALPYAGELGDSCKLAWVLQINGVTRLVGDFVVLAHALGSDAAPANRSAGYGVSGSYPAGGASLTFVGDEVVAVVLEGADLLAPLVDQAVAAADRATTAAQTVAGSIVAGDTELAEVVAKQPFNGAAITYRVDGQPAGWSVPVGSSGKDTLLQPRLPLIGGLAGSVVHVVLAAAISNPTRPMSHAVSIERGAGGVPVEVQNDSFVQSAGMIVWSFDYTLTADDVAITPLLQIASAAPVTTAETLTLAFTSLRYVTSTDPLRNPGELNRAAFRARLTTETAAMIERIRPTIVTVKADGSGDFLHPADAVAAIVDASAMKPYVVLIHPGRYTGRGNWSTKDHVDLVGTDRGSCALHWEQPDDASRAQLEQSQIFYLNSRTRVANLTLTARNVRYVVHLDDNNARNIDSRVAIQNVTMVHLGNDRAANADPAAALVPFGCGVNSGMELLIDDVDAIGPAGGGLAFHNNVGSKTAARATIRNSRSVALQAGRYTTFTSLGSGRADAVTLEGCDYGSGINMTCPSWPTVAPAELPADRCEIEITGSSMQPAAFRITLDNARALRITSADATAATAVEVDAASSGAKALFGRVVAVPGGAGLPAAARSWLDVSGEVAGSSLGQRLGDCRTTNKVLPVRFQGGAWINVTFSTDLRGASNADVVAQINAQLGAAGAADLWAVTSATRRPRIGDEERSLVNATATAILKGSALAFAGSAGRVRPMTSADPFDLFAGFAWENILSGRSGRVKTRGYLPLEDVLADGVGAFGEQLAFRDRLGIGATPGRLVKGAAVPIVAVVEVANPGMALTATLSVRL